VREGESETSQVSKGGDSDSDIITHSSSAAAADSSSRQHNKVRVEQVSV